MRDLVRYLADVLRLGSFLLFLATGLFILLRRDPSQRRRHINLFLVYVLAVNFAVGIFQRDAWPFSPYPLMRGAWNAAWVYDKLTVAGVDASGAEWDVDPLSWSPVFPLVMQEWFKTIFPELSPGRQREAARFLLERAERARATRARGARLGNERFLGALAAPDWWLYRRVTSVSPRPFVAIRFYRESWRPAEKLRDPSKSQRKLLAEYVRSR
jgi:hypothetical protein